MYVHGNIEQLEWESEFFSLPTVKLNNINDTNAKKHSRMALNRYSRIQAKVPAQQYDVYQRLQKLGFQFIEGESDFLYTLNDVYPASERVVIAEQNDIESVTSLARQAFQFSRFRHPWYKITDSQRLYSLWAEKAILGTFDDSCLVIKDSHNQLHGFITLRLLAEGDVRIGLFAVSEEQQRQGVGRELFKAALHWSYAHHAKRLYVATQSANMNATSFYLRQGAMIEQLSYWFYR